MKALILNSGMGSRMGQLTADKPKCMVELSENGETILSRQLKMLKNNGVSDVVITTGFYDKTIQEYCRSAAPDMNFTFVKNEQYDSTNYIYSIYLAREKLKDDIILMHGDLVFSYDVMKRVLDYPFNCIVTSSTKALPEKDFKGVIERADDGQEFVVKVGIEFFESAKTVQPLYKILQEDWLKWLEKICEFCKNGNVKCYAELALNELGGECHIHALEIEDKLCEEIDNAEDYQNVRRMVSREK